MNGAKMIDFMTFYHSMFETLIEHDIELSRIAYRNTQKEGVNTLKGNSLPKEDKTLQEDTQKTLEVQNERNKISR